MVLVALLLLTGCGSLNRPVEGPPPAGPPDGHARVYFALNQGFPSAAAAVVEDGKLLGYVENNEHFVVDVPAGNHFFMLISSNDEALDGQLMAGKTYHIRMFVSYNGFTSMVHWTPLKNTGEDLAGRKKDIEETQLVEVVPEKRAEWEADEKENMAKRLQSFRSGEDKPSHTLGAEHAL